MVLVAKVRLSMLLGPARILVFLSVLCRFLLPLKRGLARLYCRIILARVTLARRGNHGRVNDLSAHRQITLGLEIAVKLIEQPFDRARQIGRETCRDRVCPYVSILVVDVS